MSDLEIRFESFRDQSILDVGCGLTGIVYFINAKRKVGLDPLAYQYYQWNGYWGSHVELIQAIGEKIPLINKSFDTVFCINALDHAYEPSTIILEIRRVLKPGGMFVLHVDLDSPLRKLHKLVRPRCAILHPCSLSYDWLMDELDKGFDVLKVHRDLEVFRPRLANIKYEAFWDGLIYRHTGWKLFVNHVWIKGVKCNE